jgi:2-oxoglutarate ferredoxin oxidoreductase subunit alpha
VKDVTVIVGGKAGDGINNAGLIVTQLLNHLGYYVYMDIDYPSLIRGGHNFAAVRAAEQPVMALKKTIDFLIALDQETVHHHYNTCRDCALIANADTVKSPKDAQAISLKSILAAEAAPPITGNSAMIGAFAKAAGIPFATMEDVFRRHMPKAVDQNIRVARRAYDQIRLVRAVEPCNRPPYPVLSGNEAIGLGMAAGGLSAYVAYPMTPSSSLLHFLAENAEQLGMTVVHPENEIAVILMANGFSSAGIRTAVGTSGGGFCLMTEGLSLTGMAELPLVLVISQRTGPSTGLPTYTGQADLRFVLHAGQGEFPRFVVAPSDANEAYVWSAAAVRIAWKYQIPSFILADKTLSEGTYSLDLQKMEEIPFGEPRRWDGQAPYSRYQDTPEGISPLAFYGEKDAVVKLNSYAHDEAGVSTEEADLVALMTRKRLSKWNLLAEELDRYTVVNTGGIPDTATGLLCWGSSRGPCEEVASVLRLKVVQPLVLSPFPKKQVIAACKGIDRLIAVEGNATAQLAALATQHGIAVNSTILKFDGRPFTVDELLVRVREATS